MSSAYQQEDFALFYGNDNPLEQVSDMTTKSCVKMLNSAIDFLEKRATAEQSSSVSDEKQKSTSTTIELLNRFKLRKSLVQMFASLDTDKPNLDGIPTHCNSISSFVEKIMYLFFLEIFFSNFFSYKSFLYSLLLLVIIDTCLF